MTQHATPPAASPRHLETRKERLERRLRTDWYHGDTERNAAFVEHLEQLDRRREAARRSPALCDRAHEHSLACHDPIGIGA